MSTLIRGRASRTRPGRRSRRGAPAPTVSPVALAVTEVALVAGSLALIFGFSRVFLDRSFFGRVSAFVIVSHVLAVAVRRAGRGLLVSAGRALSSSPGGPSVRSALNSGKPAPPENRRR